MVYLETLGLCCQVFASFVGQPLCFSCLSPCDELQLPRILFRYLNQGSLRHMRLFLFNDQLIFIAFRLVSWIDLDNLCYWHQVSSWVPWYRDFVLSSCGLKTTLMSLVSSYSNPFYCYRLFWFSSEVVSLAYWFARRCFGSLQFLSKVWWLQGSESSDGSSLARGWSVTWGSS